MQHSWLIYRHYKLKGGRFIPRYRILVIIACSYSTTIWSVFMSCRVHAAVFMSCRVHAAVLMSCRVHAACRARVESAVPKIGF